MSVAMALAEALRRSSGPSTKKVVERREEQQEGMEVETHTGPRALKTPPPGTRLAPLSEVEERLEAVARVSVVPPTLAMPSLAGAGGKVVDASTLAFLSRKAVQERMAEEWKK